MNPIALTQDAYATVPALQIHERMRTSLITVVVQRELVAHRLATLESSWLVITELGMRVPRIKRAA